jgi:hypothetical protein
MPSQRANAQNGWHGNRDARIEARTIGDCMTPPHEGAVWADS